VEFDFSELQPAALWQELKRADPLITENMPDNALAGAYYQRAIEAALRKLNRPDKVVMKNEADLPTKRMIALFRSADLPKIASVQFEGAQGVSVSVLKNIAVGEEYSERDFRRLLDLNVRPLYEERGFLTVAFPRVSAAPLPNRSVAVTVVIEPGPRWILGKVSMKGDGLPEDQMWKSAKFPAGKPANWAQILESTQSMLRVLRDDGYIRAAAKPVRTFHDANHVVDVTMEITRGPQFVFGSLAVEGLDAVDQERAMKLWKLPAGAVMKNSYIDEYLQDTFKRLNARPRSANREFRARPGTNIIDLTLQFK